MQPSDQLAAFMAYPAIPLLSNILKSTSRGFSGAAHGPRESSLRTQTSGRNAAYDHENHNQRHSATTPTRKGRGVQVSTAQDGKSAKRATEL